MLHDYINGAFVFVYNCCVFVHVCGVLVCVCVCVYMCVQVFVCNMVGCCCTLTQFQSLVNANKMLVVSSNIGMVRCTADHTIPYHIVLYQPHPKCTHA